MVSTLWTVITIETEKQWGKIIWSEAVYKQVQKTIIASKK